MEHTYLKELEGSLKDIIDDPKVDDKKFYQALKDLIDLKLNVEEFNHKFDEISDVMTSMAKGEFNQRVDVPMTRNLFAFIGTSLNTVIEELERNVVKTEFLETLIESHPLPVIITDSKGIILFGNKAAHALTNYPPKNLAKLIIKNIFIEKTDFIDSDIIKTEERKKVTLKLYNKGTKVDVLLSIQEIRNKQGSVDGYIYLFE